MGTAPGESSLYPATGEVSILGQNERYLREQIERGQITSLVEVRMFPELAYRSTSLATQAPSASHAIAQMYNRAAYGDASARAAACTLEAQLASQRIGAKSDRDYVVNVWETFAKVYANGGDPLLYDQPRTVSGFESELQRATTSATPYRELRGRIENSSLNTLSLNTLYFFVRREFEFFTQIIDGDTLTSPAMKAAKFGAAIQEYNKVILTADRTLARINFSDPYMRAVRAYYAFTGNNTALAMYCKEEADYFQSVFSNPTQDINLEVIAGRRNRWKFLKDWVENGGKVPNVAGQLSTEDALRLFNK